MVRSGRRWGRKILPLAVLLLLAAGCTVVPPAERRAPLPAPQPQAAVPVEPPAALSPGEETVASTRPAPEPEPVPEPTASPLPSAREEPAVEGVTGVATYYARRFEGRKTASGEVYDPGRLTAAHQSLPFGTRVRVVNLGNGREVTVRVNDRCRQRSFPFIDLSRAAARKLGYLGKGTAKVRIIVLPSEKAEAKH